MTAVALQATDGPFFLKDNDESTCVKAMARSLKTPDSGLGPGLYEADSARRKHHVPKVMLGMHLLKIGIVSVLRNECSPHWCLCLSSASMRF